MRLSFFYIVICLGLCLFSSSCSSPKDFTVKDQPKASKKAGKTTEWDYDKIRRARQEEQRAKSEESQIIDSVPTPKISDPTIDCHPLTRSQVERAKLKGCKKLDPKEGYGDDMFCCPKP